MEDAFQALQSRGDNPTLASIARLMGIKGPALFQVFDRYTSEIRALADLNPSAWSGLRSLKRWRDKIK